MSVIDLRIKRAPDRSIVGRERIGCDLRSVQHTRAQVVNEDRSVSPSTSSDMKTGNELRIGIERNKSLSVSKLTTICKLRCALLFHADKCPKLIELKPLAVEVSHFSIHQIGASSRARKGNRFIERETPVGFTLPWAGVTPAPKVREDAGLRPC
jgi:hypothetical protein